MSDIELEIEFSDDENINFNGNKNSEGGNAPLMLQNLKTDFGALQNSGEDNKMSTENIQKEPKRVSNNSQKTVKLESDIMKEFESYNILHPYRCKMTINDVEINNQNQRYFSLMVLEKPGEGFGCLSIWGRVNEFASHEFLQYDLADKTESLEKFCQIFEEKTLNKWSDNIYDSFKPQSGAYAMMCQSMTRNVQEDKDFQKKIEKRRLDLKLQLVQERWTNAEQRGDISNDALELLGYIFDYQKLYDLFTEVNLDTTKIHFSQITTSKLNRCMGLLGQVQEEMLKKNRRNRVLLEVISELDELIPLRLRDNRLDDFHTLKERTMTYQKLRAAETFNILLRGIDVPEDEIFACSGAKIYRSLNCELNRVQYTDETFKVLQDSMFTHGNTHKGFTVSLREAFAVKKQGETEKFNPFTKLQRKMLWSSGKPVEMLTRLKNSVQAPIQSAPSTSYLFGKGIYFTDVVSKAAVNSFTNRVDNQCLLLLCDVATGEEHKLLKPKILQKAPKFNHSVVGVGKQAPASFKMLDGAKLAYGDVVDNSVLMNSLQIKESSFAYNEYVVYDQGQVRMAY